ncbi:hypothetical protein [Trichormus variabilis]|uniref:hypothetical protein n=1 Tax=Anabaena variabilis TaxID=264691 RepID=UPI000F8ECF36|nr:hypothetical protein [Trichormus variabilis]MBD2625354.1 hypothetical protein [Trichormus variabilis FACHB-164]
MTSSLAPPNSSIVYFTTASELQGLSFGECLAVDAGHFGCVLSSARLEICTNNAIACYLRQSITTST